VTGRWAWAPGPVVGPQAGARVSTGTARAGPLPLRPPAHQQIIKSTCIILYSPPPMSVVDVPPARTPRPGSDHQRQLLGEVTGPHDPLQGARGGRLAPVEAELKNQTEETNPPPARPSPTGKTTSRPCRPGTPGRPRRAKVPPESSEGVRVPYNAITAVPAWPACLPVIGLTSANMGM
jgi:hypothetical protein